MMPIALVRVAEPWTVWNVLGALFLVALAVGVAYWFVRRR
jgi:hypothetical protein